MLERTKRRHTRFQKPTKIWNLTVSFMEGNLGFRNIPEDKAGPLWDALSALSSYKVEDEEWIDASAFMQERLDRVGGNPEYREGALAVRGYRHREDLTQAQLAEKIGITRNALSDLETAKRPVSRKMAKKLAEVLGAPYKMFL